MQLADAKKEMGEVKTISPYFHPNARQHKCKAAVPFETTVQYFA